MTECHNCTIVETPRGGGVYDRRIQHCEACTKAHEILAERDALQVRLDQSKKLYEITLANELRWMRKHEEVDKEMDALRERSCWRPISEMHEDLGQCILVNIADCGYMEFGNNLNLDWDESKLTHFAQIPLLGQKEYERMKDEVEAAKEHK